ncbi:MAG: pentapeptide repeat-containing protein [Bifidobacteriaceae bacterium]|nr:pentapeptide repeat-containing protein [Bifidobacteriaceae bacterium]
MMSRRGKNPPAVPKSGVDGSLTPHKWLLAGAIATALVGLGVAGGVFFALRWAFPSPVGVSADEWLYNLVRSTIAAVGVLTGGGAAFIAYRRQRSIEAQNKLDQAQNRIDQTRSETDRYARAVDQLGNPAAAIRLGGIYALEHLAKDSTPNQQMIVEVLAGFTRNRMAETAETHWQREDVSNGPITACCEPTHEALARIPTDVKAALTVLSRLASKRGAPPGDLSHVSLSRADLPEFTIANLNLFGADLREANLRGADLSRSSLRNANLMRADLSHACLGGADLSRADAGGANLREADLREADLREADLHGTDLRRAKCSRANMSGAGLGGANLARADLAGTDLTGVSLRGARLHQADLTGADLRGANLTQADLADAVLANADFAGADMAGANLARVALSGEQAAYARTRHALNVLDDAESLPGPTVPAKQRATD